MSVNTGSSSGSSGRDSRPSSGSVLAPSKFSSNFLSSGSNTGSGNAGSIFGGSSFGSTSSSLSAKSEPTKSFPGFKASKLSSVTGSLFGGSSDRKTESPASTTTLTSSASPWTKPASSPPPPEPESAQEKKPVITFLPLQPKAPLADGAPSSGGENGAQPTTAGVSPAKRSPEKPEKEIDDETPTKRVRLETVQQPQIKTNENLSAVKSDHVTKAEEEKKTLSPTASKSEAAGFVFGENLTERADNFSKANSEAFVFGQNLTERAENFSPEPSKEPEAVASSGASTSTEPKSTPSVATGSGPDPKSPPKSLTESAAAYYESHATPKRKYDEVIVVTGEEGEVNVVQMSAKLHWFDKATGNWTERGRGVLRLNDIAEVNAKTSAPPSSSRLVMRTAGSLRVILNTKLYRGMPVECPTEKNIRLTGMDDSGVLRVFLVTGATKDISNMHAALQFRLAAIEKAAKDANPGEDSVGVGEAGRGGAGSNGSDNEDSDSDDECEAKIKAPRLA